MKLTPELIELLEKLDKISPMTAKVIHFSEMDRVVEEMKLKGYRVASVSNAGLTSTDGLIRVTLLHSSEFKGE